MENCVNESMISKNEDYIDIIEDIKEECETFGTLLRIVIPRRGAGICYGLIIEKNCSTNSFYFYSKLIKTTWACRGSHWSQCLRCECTCH